VPDGGYYVSYNPSNLFQNMHSFDDWEIFLDIPHWGIFGRVTCLDQLRASENIFQEMQKGGSTLIANRWAYIQWGL